MITTALLAAAAPAKVPATDAPAVPPRALVTLEAPPPLGDALGRLVKQDGSFQNHSVPARESLSTRMRLLYDEVSCRLDKELRAQFLGLSNDSLRAEWMRRYWKLSDPTPMTDENELQAEHEQRVAYARASFPWPLPPYWDDRGRTYILLGPPDQVTENPSGSYEGIGYVSDRQDWTYARLGTIVRFMRLTPSSRWTMSSATVPPSTRPDDQRQQKQRLGIPQSVIPLDFDLRTMLAETDPDQMLGNAAVQDEIASHGGEAIARRDLARAGESRVASGRGEFVLAGAPEHVIPCAFAACAFRGDGETMRFEIQTQIDLQSLRFVWHDSLYIARYRCEVLLQDESLQDVARDEYEETIPTKAVAVTKQPLQWPGQMVVAVRPAQYRLIVRVRDTVSGNEGTYVSQVNIRRLGSGALSLSDIEMATAIVERKPGLNPRFVKGDHVVVPNPLHVYPRGRTVIGYLEMYGLELDQRGSGRYRISYSIGRLRSDGTLAGRITTSTFDKQTDRSDPVEELRIDARNLQPGSYDLLVAASDLASGAADTTRSTFSIPK
jgi:GWxTD domain-containing protein